MPANNLLLRALALQPNERTPLWVMRQAGRYLPEYRAVRRQAGSFMDLCRSSDFACTVALQPVERFQLDAAIVFSDILTIPDGFGLGLGFIDGKGPQLARPLRDEKDFAQLSVFTSETIAYVGAAVRACKDGLAGRVPLIGFAGGPFTLACYMIDGHGGEFLRARALLRRRPDLFKRLLELNADAVAKSLAMQATAGADVLMVFDSWAGLVPAGYEQECLAQPLRLVLERLAASDVTQPVIAFWRNACVHAELAVTTGIAGLGVDWNTDLAALYTRVGDAVALQGNLDPAVLLTDPDTIYAQVGKVLTAHGGVGHIFNLGHGINKDTPPEHMEALVAAVREQSVTGYAS